MDPKLPTQINYDDELQARDMKIAKLLKKIDELKDEVEGLKEDLAAYECTDTEETEETTRTDEATMSGVNNGKQQMVNFNVYFN
eukprot:gene9099-1193_t